jgi:hypothetical protein
MPDYFGTYSKWSEKVGPQVRLGLEGRRKVIPQTPLAEAWLTLSLFYGDSPLRLEEIVEIADGINHAIPNSDETAWALLRMRSRGWLDESNGLYGLTPEGRRTIENIVGEGTILNRLDRLKEWVSSHPASEQ